MLERIISGGQTGADQGGLEAAKIFGIATGGYAPQKFMTENGPAPWLGTEYGLKELSISGGKGYAIRTDYNAKDSDATVRFATHWESKGEICTLKAIQRHKKAYADVDCQGLILQSDSVTQIAQWLENVKILNIAGNRESTCPGLQVFVRDFLVAVFEHMGLDKAVEIDDHQD